MEKPKNLGEVKRGRLPGYELKTGYALLLKHGLMGTFPALYFDREEPVVCVDRQLLAKVWQKLPKREARILEMQLYVNVAEKIGFDVSIGDQAEPLYILSEAEFEDRMNREEEPFKWAPGLLSLRDEREVCSPFE